MLMRKLRVKQKWITLGKEGIVESVWKKRLGSIFEDAHWVMGIMHTVIGQ